ncbi:MAG: hypothetical protein ACD_5C00358G0002 [uncultured bacterium]|nr:MAG: hypothetical protein ACD_5C00358G0002 [uncultured bacterium]
MIGWIIEAIKALFEGDIVDRCPNCEGLFSKNGEGGLPTMSYYEEGSAEPSYEDEVTICLMCLENPGYLDKIRIADGLRRRGKDADEIDQAMDAIDLYSKGDLAYDTWDDPR